MSEAKPDDDFYGVEITIAADGSRQASYHGGYEPRDLTADELLLWLILAENRLKKAGKIEQEPASITA